MPKQNRVSPFGEIIAVPERGTFMGNRGVLHDEEGQIRRAWQLKRWIVCLLEFRGRKRTVMTPNHYTELFFLDEATALAAGHRPCAECRRPRFIEFCNAWNVAHATDSARRSSVETIDSRLHAERVATNGSRLPATAALAQLPDGVFVSVPAWGAQAHLIWGDELLEWSPGGYRARHPRPMHEPVHLLTPKSTVEVIRAGYTPEVHATAKC